MLLACELITGYPMDGSRNVVEGRTQGLILLWTERKIALKVLAKVAYFLADIRTWYRYRFCRFRKNWLSLGSRMLCSAFYFQE